MCVCMCVCVCVSNPTCIVAPLSFQPSAQLKKGTKYQVSEIPVSDESCEKKSTERHCCVLDGQEHPGSLTRKTIISERSQECEEPVRRLVLSIHLPIVEPNTITDAEIFQVDGIDLFVCPLSRHLQ